MSNEQKSGYVGYQKRPNEIELVGERTRTAKVFTDGSQKRIVASIASVHYRSDPFGTDRYREIDLTLKETPESEWDYEVVDNGYQVRIWNSRQVETKTFRMAARFQRAGRWLAMAPVALVWENDHGEREIISRPQATDPVIDNDTNTITWTDAFGPGIHFGYNIRPDEFFKTVVIDKADSMSRPTIDLSGVKLTVVMAITWDEAVRDSNGFANNIKLSDTGDVDDMDGAPDEDIVPTDRYSYQDAFERDVFWVQQPRAWDSSDEQKSIDLEWRLCRHGSRPYMLLSLPGKVLARPDIEYPVYMDLDISEEQVGASYDDAYFRKYIEAYSRTQTFGGIGRGAANDRGYHNAVRFTTVPVPAGAVIDSAAISLRCFSSQSGTTVYARVRAEAADDPAEFPATAAEYKARFGSLTTSVDWDNVPAHTSGTWYDTPDIKTVVQALTDRPGWNSGQSMVFFIDDDDYRTVDNSARRYFSSYDHNPTRGAKLNISYTPSSSSSSSSSHSTSISSSASGTSLPKFTDHSGGAIYSWEEWPDEGDPAGEIEAVSQESVALVHTRNNVMANREVLDTRDIFRWVWHGLTVSQAQSLQAYSKMAYFRYYPDSQSHIYIPVYCPADGWKVDTQRGGFVTVTMRLRQCSVLVSSSSSSRSSMSSSSSSSQ